MSRPWSPRVLGTGGRRAACAAGAHAVVPLRLVPVLLRLSLEQKLDTLAVWSHQGEDSQAGSPGPG